MGFTPFSLGIQFPEVSDNKNMYLLDNITLKSVLFDNLKSEQIDFINYKENRSLFFSYIATKRLLS